MTTKPLEKRYFHTLDALRFFAFFKVFLLHLPEQGDFPVFEYLKSGGGLGVQFFFVLSGFLITYILTFEKANRQQIQPKKFFIRRALRIFPVFYLCVLVAFLLPYDFKSAIGFHMIGGGYEFDWRYSFTFLENYKMLLADNFPKTTPLSVFWSLCIEEHFYLVWMFLMYLLPVKYFRNFLLFAIPLAITARYFEPQIIGNQMMYSIDLVTNLDLFAIGGLLGFHVVFYNDEISKFVLKIPTFIKVILTIFSISIFVFHPIFVPQNIEHFSYIFAQTIVGLACVLLILLFIPKDSTYRISDDNILSYLGRISYGLYVYHIIVIHVLFKACLKYKIVLDNWLNLGGFMIISFLVAVLISRLSYQYFEKPILKFREKIR